MFTRIARRAAVLLGGGLIAATVLVAPSASAAPNSPDNCPNYTVSKQTNTQLTISPRQPDAGETFTATATVKSGGVPVTGGTATFKFNGITKSKAVVNGKASVQYTVPASGGRFTITVSYSGQCVGGSVGAIGTSGGRKAIVAGVSASRGKGGKSSGIGGLAATGMTSQTELFGVLGLGMIVVGGLALTVHRRRVNG